MLRDKFGCRNIEAQATDGKVHVWQWLETMMDEPMKKSFLESKVGDTKGFEATIDIGKVIVKQMKSDPHEK